MHGGYNIETLVGLLEDSQLAQEAAEQLKHTLLMFEAFHDVEAPGHKGQHPRRSCYAKLG